MRGVRHLLLPVVAGVLLICGGFRTALEQGRDVDVLIYSAAAVRSNAARALPYLAAWDNKGPLALALYQALFAVFGAWSFAAVAGAWLVLAGAGAALARALGVAMGLGGEAGWAALLYSVSVTAVGSTLNTELPASVLAGAAALLFCRGAGRGESSLVGATLAGAVLALSFLCRQNAGALLPLLLLAEAGRAGAGSVSSTRALRRALCLCAGFLGIVGLVVALYAALGQLQTFFFLFYSYNARVYVPATRINAARLLAAPGTALRQFLAPMPTASFWGAVGIVWVVVATCRRGKAAVSASFTSAFVVSGAAVALTLSLFVGLSFFTHYFALPLPFWVAAAGFGFVSSLRGARERGHPLLALAIIALTIGSLGLEVVRRAPWRPVALGLRSIREHGLHGLSDLTRVPNHDVLAATVARQIRAASTPLDAMFVWGIRPHFYAYSERLPATRFVNCMFLTGLVPWERSAPEDDTTPNIVPGAWDRLMEDLEREPPLFILDASDDRLFGHGVYAPERFPRLRDFLATGYREVGREADQSGDSVVIWRRRGP
jgi:hypothetical protein